MDRLVLNMHGLHQPYLSLLVHYVCLGDRATIATRTPSFDPCTSPRLSIGVLVLL